LDGRFDNKTDMRMFIGEKARRKRLLCATLFPRRFWPVKKTEDSERFLLRKKGKRPTIFFVDMEIMRTTTSFVGKVCGPACCFLLCTASGVLASDVVLQKVPLTTVQAPANPAQSRLGPQATFALINYNLRDAHAKARALYVSSGNDLTLANSMIDDQVATSFGFSAEDKSPTAVIDLGKVCTVRRLSAVYSARPGSIDFYVMQSLPGADRDNSASTVKLDSNALASLKRVGSAIDDGTQGSASVDFPATTGRYVMLRWIPAAHDDSSFTVAEVSAFGAGGGSLLASNGNFSSNQTTSERTVAADSKDIADSKDVSDSKDIPEEGPKPPAEGPPPRLPDPPPFTFIPQLVPASE
jgi:hypothetical protein